MENISPYEFIAAFAAIVVAVIGGLTLILNHNMAYKKHYIEKKMRLLDFLKNNDNRLPTNQTDEAYLRNLIYDFCNKKISCTKLFIICVNRPDSERAIESYYVSGHLFYFCSCRRKIVRKFGGPYRDVFKAIMLFIYYAALVVLLWAMVTIFPTYLELETRTQIYTYLIIFSFIIAVAAHSMVSLGTGGKRMRSNRMLSNILKIKDSDLPL